MSPIAREIESYYEQGREADRLFVERGELERVRTQSILVRHLPAPPATIVDVGGAAGVYAFPLAEAGYRVHLVDPVGLHLEQARERAAKSGVMLGSIARGDARHLGFGRETADAVLLLGPLYHLVERAERVLAIREAHRVLKPGGLLAAAAISRFASFIDGMLKGFFNDARFRGIVAGALTSGVHRNTIGGPNYFTTAYFHRPDELGDELRDGGFGDPQVLGVEGVAWSGARFHEVWSNQEARGALMEFLCSMEREPSILGASAHFIAVARKMA